LSVNSHNHDLNNSSHRHQLEFGYVNYLLTTGAFGDTGKDVLVRTTSGNSTQTFNTSYETAGNSTDSESPGVNGSTAAANLTISGSTGSPTGFGGTTAARGGGQSFDNRPAYYSLAFIMFKGAA